MKKQEMQSFCSSIRWFGLVAPACFVALGLCGLSAYGQQAPQSSNAPAASQHQDPHAEGKMMDDKETEVAHAFFTHMGVPEAVGVFSLRLGGLGTRAEGQTDGDFAFHFETGLTEIIGIHVRNDRFFDRPLTEVMFQFAAVRSKNGMSGFSPLIEFEIPTRSGGGKRIHSLIGFSTALANSRASFNQVLHYNPQEDMVDGSAAFVFKAGTRFFPVVEVLGEAMPDERPIINLLGGLKVRVNESLLLGVAVQAPVTGREDFSWQLIFQPDIEWGKMQ